MAGVLALWGVAWLAVPSLLKNQLEKEASAQLGRKVTVGAVDFKPWTLELTLKDLAVARAEGATELSPQLAIKRLYIDAELQSLFRLAPVLDAIEVASPRLSLTHLGGGHYDVDDILARLSSPSDQPASAPLGFALYNLTLFDGALSFMDRRVDKIHELSDLQIKLPFLSNLDSKRDVVVQPKLAFVLNGSRFDSNAQGTPFAQTHKTDATFKLTDLDVAPYLVYLPASLPVKLTSAVFNADLKLVFEQSPKTQVKLSGLLQAGSVKLETRDAKSPELLAFDLLKLSLTDVRPLERVAQLAAMELSGASLNVHRTQSGLLNLAKLSTPAVTKKTSVEEAAVAGGLKSSESTDWKLGINQVQVNRSAIHWTDDATAPVARLSLRDVAMEATGIAVPFVQPFQFGGSANLMPTGGAKPDQTSPAGALSFKGSATDVAANVTATLGGLPLTVAAPYVAQFLKPTLGGTLKAELGVNWQASVDPAKPADLQVAVQQLTLDGVDLSQGRKRLASIKKLQLEQAQVDLNRQTVTVNKLSVNQPSLTVGREADGQWMFERWLTAERKTAAGSVAGKASATPVPPWGVAIQNLALDGGALAFSDHSNAKPVALDLAALSVQLKNFSTTGRKPFQMNVSTQMRAGPGHPGRLAWRGTLGLSPLAVQGNLEAVRLPLHAFEPYLADALNLEILKAEGSFKGPVSYTQTAQGPVVKVKGDSAIEEFRANSLPQGEELLSMKLLNLRGLDLAIVPGRATSLNVQETVLSDFFARLILSEAGRLNFQDVMKSRAPTTAPVPVTSAPSTAEAQAPKLSVANANADLKPVISFGPISLLGGRVNFSDRFIKPNYSANLTELVGKLSAFSSQVQPGGVQLADLDLRGRAEGTALLEITGKLNPLATPLALDIQGRVRDLELAPLSPYSVRYAGYGIERGKLSVDVVYQVQPDGQLTASNKLVLNQLTFGDKVEGAPASLPVKLAVALLADRNGVIDINLPISGSLNDPQFKLAPLVFKLILNLVAKAITSPFSLLASALGGSADELGMVIFAPGSADLTQDAKAGLDKVVKALLERQGLKVTIVGTASLEMEHEAYRREQLKALLVAEKNRVAIINGSSTEVGAEGQGAVSAAEFPVLLKAVYRRADFPKPRNLIGLVKDIPPAEMEALLLAHLPASEESMRELALRRGVRVRDYLAAQKLPSERLFLGAAKALAPEAKWSPRAELNLTTH